MSSPATTAAALCTESRKSHVAPEADYLSADATSSASPEQRSIVNHTAEPYSSASPPETPRLEDLQLRDRSLTPGKSRKRQLPQESAAAASAPIRPRPQPNVFTPNYDDGTHRVFAGARKHTAYDFDSPVASMSVLEKRSQPTNEIPVNKLTLQPETRQITEEQLINEVRTIYAGLVLVERKCVEIDRQQANNPSTLTNEQWQALTALHRTLLHEHHDFFLASQHPSASPALQRLASRYAMPARMWRHAIHSFLELLRHRLPEVLDHMLAFIYTAYSMMALLLESVPSFEDTWIECLGDLARYKMAVEESDLRDREVWAGVARYWYNKAADKSPMVGRIQHHLAVLARPNILLQLFFYSKSLICVHPFPNTKDSILLLFSPCLEQKEPLHHPPLMLSFVRAHGVLFNKQSILSFLEYGYEFISFLETQIGRVGSKWREQGIYFASANFVSLFEYDLGSFIGKAFVETTNSPVNISEIKDSYYTQHSTPASKLSLHPVSHSGHFQTSVEVISYASCFAFHTLALVLKHIGDKNVLPHVHVSLAFLWSLALVPEGMSYAQSEIPWQALVTFLNTLNTQGLNESRLKSQSFPMPESGMKCHLPEDFSMRGLIWSQLYYPSGFFNFSTLEDDEERSLEPPSITAPRTERCLWIGHRLASLDIWISFNEQQKKFIVKDFALELENYAQGPALFDEAGRFFSERERVETKCEKKDNDMHMMDIGPVQMADHDPRSVDGT
ncbi:uncharacterized protein CIMG_05962 [Coccidioides immitis RS]|uniref:DNA/RNA-binding domain-containing protein n=4 Tax=Coccidioides immitis TaxID=5501 RepID=J3K750_COCIM|nr:uncharacterized protein CIMG_05962 [Coccidioides immitis RS]EAS30483.3 hypothetical protein CIMG_05962 [Coccidioides immitis RS]KMP03026.1 hypothetical protein CIRG_02718 [Coccidioides immitis RMSCC 2394]